MRRIHAQIRPLRSGDGDTTWSHAQQPPVADDRGGKSDDHTCRDDPGPYPGATDAHAMATPYRVRAP
eukprot:7381518-Prymnesium_polylepis.1